jgi:hypothetical protein
MPATALHSYSAPWPPTAESSVTVANLALSAHPSLFASAMFPAAPVGTPMQRVLGQTAYGRYACVGEDGGRGGEALTQGLLLNHG